VNTVNLPAFIITVLVIAATPGPAIALILRRAGVGGFRAAVPTVLGIEVGLYIWALAVGLGLATLVTASETAFLIWRLAGALFLVYLGIRAIRSGWALRAQADVDPLPPVRRSGHGAFAEGVLVQLANPKAAVFLFAFYPQFLPADTLTLSSAATLGLVQVMIELPLYLLLAGAVGSASRWFSRTGVRRRLEYLSGSVLIALGVRVALSDA
jgi:threonine/homoserine/homoserine lactone efflux protein